MTPNSMCEYWAVGSKVAEFAGAMMLVVPLYKAAYVQYRYARSTEPGTKRRLQTVADRGDVDGASASVSRVAQTMLTQPVVIANTMSSVEFAIIAGGFALFIAGSVADILERGRWICH